MTDGFAIVHPADLPTDAFVTSEPTVTKLTEPLGCTEMRLNVVMLEPGEETESHVHPGQEEVFLAQTDAEIEIDGTHHDVSEGSVVRVREDVPRNLVNTSEAAQQVWLAIGAPPVGSVEDFGAFSKT